MGGFRGSIGFRFKCPGAVADFWGSLCFAGRGVYFVCWRGVVGVLCGGDVTCLCCVGVVTVSCDFWGISFRL